MMKFWHTLVLGMFFVAGTTSMAADSIYDFKMKDIEGKEVELSEFKDKVVLIVNVASRHSVTSTVKRVWSLWVYRAISSAVRNLDQKKTSRNSAALNTKSRFP
jgi:hypothetical protein